MTTNVSPIAKDQHRLIHDLYVLLDDGDRRVLGAHQLSPLEFAVLQQLDTDQGQRLTDVGAKLLCVKSTITRVVDRLERENLVVRTADPDDRRAQRLLLTPHGAQVRLEAIRNHEASVERRMSLLSDDEQHQLAILLTKLRNGLRDELAPQHGFAEEVGL